MAFAFFCKKSQISTASRGTANSAVPTTKSEPQHTSTTNTYEPSISYKAPHKYIITQAAGTRTVTPTINDTLFAQFVVPSAHIDGRLERRAATPPSIDNDDDEFYRLTPDQRHRTPQEHDGRVVKNEQEKAISATPTRTTATARDINSLISSSPSAQTAQTSSAMPTEKLEVMSLLFDDNIVEITPPTSLEDVTPMAIQDDD